MGREKSPLGDVERPRTTDEIARAGVRTVDDMNDFLDALHVEAKAGAFTVPEVRNALLNMRIRVNAARTVIEQQKLQGAICDLRGSPIPIRNRDDKAA